MTRDTCAYVFEIQERAQELYLTKVEGCIVIRWRRSRLQHMLLTIKVKAQEHESRKWVEDGTIRRTSMRLARALGPLGA